MISSLAVPRGAENHYGAPGFVGQKLIVEVAFSNFVDEAGVVNIKVSVLGRARYRSGHELSH